MSSGHVLSGVVPTEEEYERVEYDEVKELLQFIFTMVIPPVSDAPKTSGWKFWKKREEICNDIELTSKKMIKKVNYR